MKVCKYCNIEKSLDEFSRRKGTTRSNRCKSCQRTYSKQHYNNNKAKYLERNILYNGKIRDEVLSTLEALKSKPCTDCNKEYPPYVMDFDHLAGFEKYMGISVMVGRGHKLENILKEISKCELVCSNCHRIRTYKRRVKQIKGD